MGIVFLDPGGDATFTTDQWDNLGGGTAPSIVSDFVHGTHQRSMAFALGQFSYVLLNNRFSDSGGRASIYIYINALPNSTSSMFSTEQVNDGTSICSVAVTSGGVVELLDSSSALIGNVGPTITTGNWFRLCLAWRITNSTTNEFRLFMGNSTVITATNVTLPTISTADLQIGNGGGNATFDFRVSDIYTDNSNGLNDPGDVWVTAKRPNANGTTNNFITQIGSGGSDYGTGHAPQVNERPDSTINGWSVVAVGSPVTEEYNIENKTTGDIDISGATIVDYQGWVIAKALTNETAQIIINNVASNISITTVADYYFAVAGSTVFPLGTGKDIGIIASTTVTTVSLYECGIVVAFLNPSSTPGNEFKYLSVGNGLSRSEGAT